MSRDVTTDKLPTIIVRVPGMWKGRQELAGRLPDGFQLKGDRLKSPDGPSMAFETLPADLEFPNVFRMACRRSLKANEFHGLDRYAMNAVLVGPGGSKTAAQQMLETAASIVRAGGIGVFIDNCAIAHSGSDWLELAAHRDDPAALFYTFVNIVKRQRGVTSHGMHILGQRDGLVRDLVNLDSLEDFLRKAAAKPALHRDGETFSDRSGNQFCLRGEPDEEIFPNHPINNPYGRWRLEPIV